MSGESPATNEVVLSVEAYSNPIEAFNTVGAAILSEAQSRGLIAFEEGQMKDAIDTLNTVAQQVGDDTKDPLYDKLGFGVEMHDTDDFKHAFSFGIEAVYKNGNFRIWWPQ